MVANPPDLGCRVPLYPYATPYPLVDEELTTAPADATLDEARETAHALADEAGIEAAAVGEIGDPTTAILDAAEAHNADVIVVGATDKSWWRRLIDGSVSNARARIDPSRAHRRTTRLTHLHRHQRS